MPRFALPSGGRLTFVLRGRPQTVKTPVTTDDPDLIRALIAAGAVEQTPRPIYKPPEPPKPSPEEVQP